MAQSNVARMRRQAHTRAQAHTKITLLEQGAGLVRPFNGPELNKDVLAKYRVGESDTLCREELIALLRDHSLKVCGVAHQPTAEVIDFLISLADPRRSDVTSNDLKYVSDIWADFLTKRMSFSDIFERHAQALSRTDMGIDMAVLQSIFKQVHHDPVPSAVTAWAFRLANVSNTGRLNEIELARGIAVFNCGENRTSFLHH